MTVSTEDLTGKTFGRLKVEHRHPDGGARWVCRCECGHIVTARTWVLNAGRKKSCGAAVHLHVGRFTAPISASVPLDIYDWLIKGIAERGALSQRIVAILQDARDREMAR